MVGGVLRQKIIDTKINIICYNYFIEIREDST